MEYKTISGKRHYVFENEEEYIEFFKTQGTSLPSLKPWRAGEEGDWVIADDNGIVQILRKGDISHPKDSKNYKANNAWIRTVVGTFFVSNKSGMDTDFDKHPNRYRFGGASNAEIKKRQKERTMLTKNERMFAMEVSTGKTIQEAYEASFPPTSDWRTKAIALIKRKRIVEQVQHNLKEIASTLGIDEQWIFARLKELADEEDGTVKLGAVKELSIHIGMKDTVKHTQQGQLIAFQGFSNKKLEAPEEVIAAEDITDEKIKELVEGE